MKRILLFTLTLILSACTGRILDELDKSNQVLDERIDQNAQRITELLQVCDLFNTNIASLQRIVNAMEENDFVKKVEPITDESGNIIGYSITMLKTGVFTVYNGVDGIYPEISVRKDESDGMYYWTLNGDWLYSSDNEKIRAVGVNAIDPQFKIVDGNWLLSSDGGVTWGEVGPAQGKDGWSFFSDFSFDDQMLTLTLPDGTVLSFPRYMEPEITFYIGGQEVAANTQVDAGASSGVDVIIPYTIADKSGTTMISASSDGNYSVKIQSDSRTSGRLIVTPPYEYCDGFVNVILSDEYGLSKIRVISFHHNIIEFPEGLEYTVPAEGGELQLPFKFNFDFVKVIENDWIKELTNTKAELRDSTIRFSIDKNTQFNSRIGYIRFYSKDNGSQPYSEIVINQSSAVFSMTQSVFASNWSGEHFSTEVFSSIGLKVSVSDSWIEAAVEPLGDNRYRIEASTKSNQTGAKRTGGVTLKSDDNQYVLGHIQVVQAAETSHSDDDLVFTVRATYPSDFVVELPLSGRIDCVVEWGDGVVEYYKQRPVKHEYELKSPKSYTVRVSGTVTGLSSSGIDTQSIISVDQWGYTGLAEMTEAFKGQSKLERVAGNSSDAFRDVYTFNSAFYECVSLKEVPDNLFKGAVHALYFQNVFFKCVSLKQIPSGFFSECVNMTYADGLFQNCTSLESVPDELFKECGNLSSASSLFAECKAIETVGADIFSGCKSLRCINNIFSSCDKLRSVPTSIFDSSRGIVEMNGAFISCTSLRGESPYTTIGSQKYHLYDRKKAPDYFSMPLNISGLFGGDTWKNLDDRDQIPDEYK